MKFNDLGFNFVLFANHLAWPHLEFSFHFEKVRPAYVFGIESNFHGNFHFPFKSIVFDTNHCYFCEFHPSRSKTCHGASPPIQIYRSNRFVLRYLSKERRFILTEKGKPNPQFSSLHIRQGLCDIFHSIRSRKTMHESKFSHGQMARLEDKSPKRGGMIRARPANFIEQVYQAEH